MKSLREYPRFSGLAGWKTFLKKYHSYSLLLRLDTAFRFPLNFGKTAQLTEIILSLPQFSAIAKCIYKKLILSKSSKLDIVA